MRRRDFLKVGALTVGAPTTLSLLNLSCTRAGPDAGTRAADAIRLSSNENPLGLPDPVRDAVFRGLAGGHRYPGASAGELREAIASRHAVEPGAILLGHGSTDILRMTVQAGVAASPARPPRLVQAEPTFEQAARYAAPWGVETVGIALLPSGAHDLAAMRAAAEAAPGPVLVYVCNPNNPTGTLTPVDDVRAWIDAAPEEHFFLIDEAYHEFVDDPAYHPLDQLARERRNVLVARTFSKIYAMAGIRIGYGIAHPNTIASLDAQSVATSPNHLGNVAGIAALRDDAFLERTLETNRASRDLVYATLDELGLEYMPTHANFVMHRVPGGVDPYRERMREAGILVGRRFPPLDDHNRLSLGSPSEMERWAETVRSFRDRGWV